MGGHPPKADGGRGRRDGPIRRVAGCGRVVSPEDYAGFADRAIRNGRAGPGGGAGRHLVLRSQFFSFRPGFTSNVSSVFSWYLSGKDSSILSPPGPGPPGPPAPAFGALAGLGTRIWTLAVPTGTLAAYRPFSIDAPAV